MNVADVLPAATDTASGTVAAPLLLARLTDTPPVGAGVLNVTDPVAVLPPTIELGLRVNEITDGGLIVRPALADRKSVV